MNPTPPTPNRRAVSLREKFAFTSGVITGQNSVAVLNQMLVPIYQITLGLNPMLIGTAQMIMRLWDAITDPIVAGWSDNARTRWGRRRPFVFVGGILTALAFPLIWLPSAHWGQSGLFAYLLVFCLMFLTCHTLFNIPYVSLGGAQTEFTKRWLIIGMVLGSCIPAVITFVALLFYKLGPDLMEQCRREIAEREAGEGSPG